jgi:multidrug efflux pump subunit AcrB
MSRKQSVLLVVALAFSLVVGVFLLLRTSPTAQANAQPVVLTVEIQPPDNFVDIRFLSHFANHAIKEELLKLPGVADVACYGQIANAVRIHLDREKLRTHQLTMDNVATALLEQAAQTPAGGTLGHPIPLPLIEVQNSEITLIEGVAELGDEIEQIIVKVGPESRIVRLSDVVTKLEIGIGRKKDARTKGSPAVLLVIYPLPGLNAKEFSTALQDAAASLREKHAKRLAINFLGPE